MEFRNKQQLAYARLYTFFRIFPQRNPLDFEIQNLRVLSSVEIWKLFFFLFFVSCKLQGKISNSFGSDSDENSENLLFLSFLSYY